MQSYEFVQNLYDMSLSREEYHRYCEMQIERKVPIMCKAISQLKNMSASALLKHCEQSESIPVDLKVILQKLGISAIPFDFSEIESNVRKKFDANVEMLGMVAINEDSAAIFYNRRYQRDSHRSRFTVAHELAHCCLDTATIQEQKMRLDCRIDGLPQSEDEIAANIFAGELLIPEDSLHLVINKLFMPSVHILAEIFDVSDNVMLKRLEYLNIKKHIAGYNF